MLVKVVVHVLTPAHVFSSRVHDRRHVLRLANHLRRDAHIAQDLRHHVERLGSRPAEDDDETKQRGHDYSDAAARPIKATGPQTEIRRHNHGEPERFIYQRTTNDLGQGRRGGDDNIPRSYSYIGATVTLRVAKRQGSLGLLPRARPSTLQMLFQLRKIAFGTPSPGIKSTNSAETSRVASGHLRGGALDSAAAAVVPAASSVGRHAVRHRIGSRATQPASQLEGGDRAIVHAACVHPCGEAAARWPL